MTAGGVPRHRPSRLPRTLLVLLAAAAPAAAVTPAEARTSRITSAAGAMAPLDRDTTDPVLSGSGTTAAFATTALGFLADDPNGPTADVFRVELPGGVRALVSRAADGGGADGPSRTPSLSANGLLVAFASDATNLVAGDTNGAADVFARARDGATVLVSVASDGGAADGPSSQPDVSADGRMVAFTSQATNLVPGDTNGVADVFVRDLGRGTTRRVSVSATGAQANDVSSAPALSRDGTSAAFQSSATNLVAGDTNRTPDIFVRPLDGRTERVSVATDGRQQDAAVDTPFVMAPDISGDGRYVAWDTDARSLSARDTNGRTDIYLRDRRRGITTLVSASSVNVQGDNDSVTPQLTANGRFVSFQSFATNLVPDDGPGEDLFLRDTRTRTTSLVNATLSGRRRAPEPGGRQLLQRAPVADDGRSALFLSAAPGVLEASDPPVRSLYLRSLRAPRVGLKAPVVRGRDRLVVNVTADDPVATRFLCRIDRAVPFLCGSRIRVERSAGRLLTVRAGGPGMLWSAVLVVPIGGRPGR